MRKVKLAEQISDIESGRDDTEKKKSRHNRAKRKFTSEEDSENEDSETKNSETEDSENEDSDKKSCTTQKIYKKKTSRIPPLPTLSSIRKETTQSQKKKNKIYIADDNQLESNTHIINSSLYDFNKHNMKESPISSIMQSDTDISHLRKESTSSSCNTSGNYLVN